jgi:hypothetical protein
MTFCLHPNKRIFRLQTSCSPPRLRVDRVLEVDAADVVEAIERRHRRRIITVACQQYLKLIRLQNLKYNFITHNVGMLLWLKSQNLKKLHHIALFPTRNFLSTK